MQPPSDSNPWGSFDVLLLVGGFVLWKLWGWWDTPERLDRKRARKSRDHPSEWLNPTTDQDKPEIAQREEAPSRAEVVDTATREEETTVEEAAGSAKEYRVAEPLKGEIDEDTLALHLLTKRTAHEDLKEGDEGNRTSLEAKSEGEVAIAPTPQLVNSHPIVAVGPPSAFRELVADVMGVRSKDVGWLPSSASVEDYLFGPHEIDLLVTSWWNDQRSARDLATFVARVSPATTVIVLEPLDGLHTWNATEASLAALGTQARVALRESIVRAVAG